MGPGPAGLSEVDIYFRLDFVSLTLPDKCREFRRWCASIRVCPARSTDCEFRDARRTSMMSKHTRSYAFVRQGCQQLGMTHIRRKELYLGKTSHSLYSSRLRRQASSSVGCSIKGRSLLKSGLQRQLNEYHGTFHADGSCSSRQV